MFLVNRYNNDDAKIMKYIDTENKLDKKILKESTMAPWRLSSAHFMPDMAVPIAPLRAVLCRCRHKKSWLLLV